MRQILRIATRKSPLALWQANFVKDKIAALYPHLKIDLIKFTTTGDKFLNTSLAKIGGKGLFTKELEQALFDNEADLAVHSMKDVQAELPEGLCLSAILKREDPRDALVSHHHLTLENLPPNAIIGTSSLRRALQVKAIIPDCTIKPLRGNINTRLDKMPEFDAIILAASGLKRLNFDANISEYLSTERFIPAAGQGALGIECREEDDDLKTLLAPLACQLTHQLVHCERAFNALLNGRCDVPIAAHATKMDEHHLKLLAMVGNEQTGEIFKTESHSLINTPMEAAKIAVDNLKKQGVSAFIRHQGK